jgi:hypothetical protein
MVNRNKKCGVPVSHKKSVLAIYLIYCVPTGKFKPEPKHIWLKFVNRADFKLFPHP